MPPAKATAKRVKAAKARAKAAAAGHTHLESENYPWTINVGNHPKRTDSPTYVQARAMMLKIAPQTGWYYGAGPYQDHHGAALWVKDEQGWFLVKNLAGIEWSAQFCADPAKVDGLRRNAKRLYAKFPMSVAAFKQLGFDLQTLLDTPITDAAGVSHWTDSICNAGIPLAAPWHTGVLATAVSPTGSPRAPAGAGAAKAVRPPGAVAAGGVHHYPTPITDIQFFKRDDFTLWVTDGEGQVAAVVPTEKADGSAEVVYATPGTKLHKQWLDKHNAGNRLLLGKNHPLAKKALTRPDDSVPTA